MHMRGFVVSTSVPESDWISFSFHRMDLRMMPRNSHPSSAPLPSSEPLGLLNALLPPSLPEQVIQVKTVEEVAVQKAIVCLYLRKRAARVVLNRNLATALATARDFEAHNALESVKRVLWRNDGS